MGGIREERQGISRTVLMVVYEELCQSHMRANQTDGQRCYSSLTALKTGLAVLSDRRFLEKVFKLHPGIQHYVLRDTMEADGLHGQCAERTPLSHWSVG